MTTETKEFTEGQKVTHGGYPGTITKVCDSQLTGMYEVRLESGLICTCGSDLVPVSAVNELMRVWLDGDHTPENIERIARYMSRTLRIGGLKACRELIQNAVA